MELRVHAYDTDKTQFCCHLFSLAESFILDTCFIVLVSVVDWSRQQETFQPCLRRSLMLAVAVQVLVIRKVDHSKVRPSIIIRWNNKATILGAVSS